MKALICGTRKKGYYGAVANVIDQLTAIWKNFEIIEGCCPNSADQYAEQKAKIEGIKVLHFPSHSGNYLKRNIEMVKLCDVVFAFWDGYSYGTAHTVAQAILQGKDARVIDISSRKDGTANATKSTILCPETEGFRVTEDK